MPKYTPEQLKFMAQEFIIDRTAGGEKSFQVLVSLTLVTGWAPSRIETEIEALANA